MGFNPVLQSDERPQKGHALSPDVSHELEMISDAGVIVLVYPIWYGMPPALLKGYIDRVLGVGATYGAVRTRFPHASLAGKRMLSFTSSATTTQWLEEQGALGSLRTLVDDYLRHALSLSATRHVHFPAIVPGLRARFVEEAMFQVQQAARQECCALRNETNAEYIQP
jgi:NAD(P)H dehydrogenase (quinone)